MYIKIKLKSIFLKSVRMVKLLNLKKKQISVENDIFHSHYNILRKLGLTIGVWPGQNKYFSSFLQTFHFVQNCPISM